MTMFRLTTRLATRASLARPAVSARMSYFILRSHSTLMILLLQSLAFSKT